MVRRISVDGFFRKFALHEKMLLVDLRQSDAYWKIHVRGAISIPFRRMDELAHGYLCPPGRQILVYGDHSDEYSPITGARRLAELGYTNVFVCVDSFDQWRHEEVPIETTPSRFRLNFI